MSSVRLPLQEFLYQVTEHPNKTFLNQPKEQIWSTFSWSTVDNQARRIANGLLAQGCLPGDRIAILAKNCAEWFIADIAIMMAGMISVPIYTTAGADIIEHVLKHSDAKAIFLGKLDSLETAKKSIPDNVLSIAMPYPTLETTQHWNDWLTDHDPLENIACPTAEDVMTIVYTSGSTGLPKGVVLSFNNAAASSSSVVNLTGLVSNDRTMSYLPLSHVVERFVVEWPSIYSGSEIFFVESLDTFQEDLQHGQPTSFVSVPRLWTKFRTKINAKIPDKKLQKLLRIPILGSLVAKKIRKGLGLNNSRAFGSGSAPIAPSILHWYSRLGINISEGWGMTETAGLSCTAMPFDTSLIGSIGWPLDCVEMNLSDAGEILIRGDAVFKEYYLNPKASEESFTDGWFHTGDLGEKLENGTFKIIGRVKEQFKTSKGKYVSPVPIESLLGKNSHIEQVCVLGSGRKQPITLIVLNEEVTSRTEAIHQSLLNTLKEINSQLESHQVLDHLIICNDVWTTENGMLTPTLKLRRSNLEKRYAHFMLAEFESAVIWEAELS